MPVVGQIAYLEPFELIDSAGELITGKVTDDWTKTLFKDGSKIGSPPTIAVAEVSGASGTYAPSFTPASAGEYRLALQVTVSGKVYRFSEPFTVIPAAADPAAIADAIAAVQSDVTTVKAMTDVATSTRATPGAYVAAGGTVATNGDIEIRRGNAYLNADGLALPWSSSSWPVLTSATITLQAESAYDDRVTFSAAGTVVTATGTTKAVRVELSEAQTAALTAGDWLYEIHAVLSSGSDVDLASGAMTVLDPLGA